MAEGSATGGGLRERFEVDGFVTTEPILDDHDLLRFTSAVDDLHARALAGEQPLVSSCVFERQLPDAKRGGTSLPESRDAVFIVGDPPRFEPCFLELLAAPALVALVSCLLGTEDIVLHFSNITTKAPEVGSGISWHRDFPNGYICPAEPTMVRTMICLDGMDAANGVTRFVPGTQIPPRTKAAEIAGIDERAVDAACRPGAVVAIHPLVLHGGQPNPSLRSRRNVIAQWGVRGVPLTTGATESVTGLSVDELRREWLKRHPLTVRSKSATI
jgi:phytanoyl-CoA hydroxylase